jgi:hypothetical protein
MCDDFLEAINAKTMFLTALSLATVYGCNDLTIEILLGLSVPLCIFLNPYNWQFAIYCAMVAINYFAMPYTCVIVGINSFILGLDLYGGLYSLINRAYLKNNFTCGQPSHIHSVHIQQPMFRYPIQPQNDGPIYQSSQKVNIKPVEKTHHTNDRYETVYGTENEALVDFDDKVFGG